MNRINPILKESYCHWLSKIPAEDQNNSSLTISGVDVLRAHYLLCDYFSNEGEMIALAGPRDLNLLLSAVNRQVTGFDGQLKWKDPLDQLATLFYGLVKNHPFHDGNKRTALLTALYHMYKLNRTPTERQRLFEVLTVDVAANNLDSTREYKEFYKATRDKTDARVHTISRFFKKYSRKEDNRYYTITFSELAQILASYGYSMENPAGNYIDIVKVEERQTGFFFKKKQVVKKKIMQIGFPGWKKQVNIKAINSIRRETGLIAEKGIDSQAFYKDADPMASLISKYHGPFMRLKDK